MPGTLVIADIKDGAVRRVTLEAIGVAKKTSDSVEVALIGSNVADLAIPLAQAGASRIRLADDPSLETYSSEGYAKVAAEIIEAVDPEYIILGDTSFGKDLAPKLAGRLRAGLASDCTALEISDGNVVFTRPIYAGKVLAKVNFHSARKIVTIRPYVFPAPEMDESKTAKVEKVAADAGEIRAVVKEIIATSGGKPTIGDADAIVAGGRGLKASENFKLIEDLADILSGAVGASRPVVDTGWIDHSHQVGQTGRTVSPNLYIACGISGAIQHLAGMASSKCIVAINKDEDAPVFQIADYGVAGDLFDVLPHFSSELKKLLAAG